MIAAYFRRQISEIASDGALRQYGAALALVNALTAIYWLVQFPLAQVLDPHLPPVCWPFFESCHVVRVLSPAALTVLVLVLFIAAVSNTAMFWQPRLVMPAYWLLLTLVVLKTLIVFQDYRLILNQHYMALWVSGTYLLLPNKRRHLALLIVGFYLWAGTLKANPEWLSGIGLYGRRPFGLPESLIPAACLYVLVIELVIVFGVLSTRSWLFWSSFAQLLLFHVASFWVVGFFYPILMFLILSLFPLAHYPNLRPSTWHGASGSRREGALLSRGAFHRVSLFLPLGGFSLLQLLPAAFTGDPSITGEGRMLALHMFDAPVECRGATVDRDSSGKPIRRRLHAPFTNVRIACDPIVYWNLARNDCRRLRSRGWTGDFDLLLESRRSGTDEFHRVVFIENFCKANPAYDVWRHNWWINPPATDAGAKAEPIAVNVLTLLN